MNAHIPGAKNIEADEMDNSETTANSPSVDYVFVYVVRFVVNSREFGVNFQAVLQEVACRKRTHTMLSHVLDAIFGDAKHRCKVSKYEHWPYKNLTRIPTLAYGCGSHAGSGVHFATPN